MAGFGWGSVEIAMPRYFFDLRDNDKDARDDVGLTFENLKEARDAAIKLLPDVAHEELPDGDRHVFAVRVRDETGRYLFFATLSLIAQDLTQPEH
jgi:hypothetical protein